MGRYLSLSLVALIAIALLRGTPTSRAINDAADDVWTTIRPEAIRADMRFLADDLLEGRSSPEEVYAAAKEGEAIIICSASDRQNENRHQP